jgi:hypothetical protein
LELWHLRPVVTPNHPWQRARPTAAAPLNVCRQAAATEEKLDLAKNDLKSPIDSALRQFEAAEANLEELDRLFYGKGHGPHGRPLRYRLRRPPTDRARRGRPEKHLCPSDVHIDTQTFIDDRWENTVNTASRMVSYAVAGGIQVTGAPYERLRDNYLFEHRGTNKCQGDGGRWSPFSAQAENRRTPPLIERIQNRLFHPPVA